MLHSDSTDTVEREPSINWKGVALVFLTPALGGFLYGYDIGATSFVVHFLVRKAEASEYSDDDFDAENSPWWGDFDQRPVLQGLLVGGVSAGALLGSHLVLFHLASWISRRAELRIASVLYLVGTLLNVLSGTSWKREAHGSSLLILGRLLFGMGAGFVMHGAPTYMSEMSPSRIRGAIVSAKETVIVTGIVAGYVAGNLVTHWTDLYLISGLTSLPFLLLTFCIPRSKRWLLMHGYRDEAKQAMQFVYQGDISDEFDALSSKLLQNDDAPKLSSPSRTSRRMGSRRERACRTISRVGSARIRPSLVAAMGLIVLQQLSGQPSILSYVTVLLATVGWSGSTSVITALIMAAASTTTVLLVEKCGRTKLLSLSSATLGISSLVLAISFWQGPSLAEEWSPWQQSVVLVAVFAYIGGYQLGFGPITWLIVSEVFPQDVRGVATALAVELNYVLNFAVQFLIPVFESHLGWGPTFLLFAASMVVAFFFVQTNIPETTGLTLEEVHGRQSPSETEDQFDAAETVASENSCLLSEAPIPVR